MPVFTLERVALILILPALLRPLCSPCLHICVCVYVCVCVFFGGRKMVRGLVCVCTRDHVRPCVLTQPSPYNLITKIRKLNEERKSRLNLEQI